MPLHFATCHAYNVYDASEGPHKICQIRQALPNCVSRSKNDKELEELNAFFIGADSMEVPMIIKYTLVLPATFKENFLDLASLNGINSGVVSSRVLPGIVRTCGANR